MSDELFERLRAGEPGAEQALFEHLYGDLRELALAIFSSQRRHHTLQPTAIVHEAYLRMARPGAAWEDRRHFLRVAARAMRQILVNHARDRAALKRGGGLAGHRVTISGVGDEGPDLEVLAVHEALGQLAELDERQAAVAEMRFFGGYTVREIADALAVSVRTVELDWKMAKDWLAVRLRPATRESDGT